MLITFWAALGLLASSGPATAVLSKEAERGRPKVLVLDLIDGTELGEARANALQDALISQGPFRRALSSPGAWPLLVSAPP